MNCELNNILDKIKGNFICVYENKSEIFASKNDFEKSNIEKNCYVSAISTQDGMIVLELKKWNAPIADVNGDWVREHEKQFGTTPSFF